VGLAVLILVPLAVAAWVRLGPVAGLVAIVWLALVVYVRNQPAGRLWGAGPYTERRSRSPRPPPNDDSDG